MITAIVTGNLGKDPELKETRSGKKMCTFSVASSEKRGDKEDTTWVDCVAFEELAEAICGDLNKGMRVVVSGRIAMEKFEKRDGSNGFSLRMMVNDIGLMIRPKTKKSPSKSDDEPW